MEHWLLIAIVRDFVAQDLCKFYNRSLLLWFILEDCLLVVPIRALLVNIGASFWWVFIINFLCSYI